MKLALECYEDYGDLLEGKRVALVTNNSSYTSAFVHSADYLRRRCNLTCLFGPEHGIRGEGKAGDAVANGIDPYTGIPTYSLYRRDGQGMTPEMLSQFDILVFDIQDLGLRFYTYLATLGNLVRDCAENGKPLVVLDRPNPLSLSVVEGNILDKDSLSFVGPAEIPIRYGKTIAEMALLFNDSLKRKCDLTIVPLKGYERAMYFDQTSLPWFATSPAIPQLSSALAYAGFCLLEGTNISEGRGTALPFEIFGAPFIDGRKLCDEVSGLDLQGCAFTPLFFTPSSNKFSNVQCQGLYLHVTDRKSFRPVATAIEVLHCIFKLYPKEFMFLGQRPGTKTRPFVRLCGKDSIEKFMTDHVAWIKQMEQDSRDFKERLSCYSLY